MATNNITYVICVLLLLSLYFYHLFSYWCFKYIILLVILFIEI